MDLKKIICRGKFQFYGVFDALRELVTFAQLLINPESFSLNVDLIPLILLSESKYECFDSNARIKLICCIFFQKCGIKFCNGSGWQKQPNFTKTPKSPIWLTHNNYSPNLVKTHANYLFWTLNGLLLLPMINSYSPSPFPPCS